MDIYYYLFSCAYWISIEDLKEKSAPQEYAFIFVSVIDLLLFVSLAGLLNLYFDRNILSGFMVISVSVTIAVLNYLLFLKANRFKIIINKLLRLSGEHSKRKRITVMVVTFLTFGTFAIAISVLNTIESSH